VTTAMKCDRNPGSRVSQFPVDNGETPWPDEDVELGLRLCHALVAALAHDLKNTLAGLILRCDTLTLLEPRLGASGDDQASVLFGTVLEQIDTLVSRSVHIVDDLLDISRLEAGHTLPLAATEVDLVALVQQVLQSALTSRRPLSPAAAEAPVESGRRLELALGAGRLAPAEGPTR
jgi:signal transduction histidine kinase